MRRTAYIMVGTLVVASLLAGCGGGGDDHWPYVSIEDAKRYFLVDFSAKTQCEGRELARLPEVEMAGKDPKTAKDVWSFVVCHVTAVPAKETRSSGVSVGDELTLGFPTP